MKERYKYAIACPTSMGLRITPQDRMAVQNSNLFYLQATSAESNVLNVASSLGKECLVLSKFVQGSPMADFIKRQLRARNIRFEGKDVEQCGPWGYFKLTQSYGITPSMSRKGNPYDNAMAENFFSILKTECIYRHKPKTLKEANALIDRYIHFYNHERIQNKTGVAPLTLRHSA